MAIATINPTTGLDRGRVHPARRGRDREPHREAAAAADALRLTDYETRAGWMRAAADLLESEVDSVARILTVEMGKPIAQSRAEVLKCAKNMRFYAEQRRGVPRRRAARRSRKRRAPSRAWTRYEPLGVVLAVMPWNYPLWQVIRFAAPALMAGNTGRSQARLERSAGRALPRHPL